MQNLISSNSPVVTEIQAAVAIASALNHTPAQCYLTLFNVLNAHGVAHERILPAFSSDEPTLTTSELAVEYGTTVEALNDYLLENDFISLTTVTSACGQQDWKFYSVTTSARWFGHNVFVNSDTPVTAPAWYRATYQEMMSAFGC